MICKKSPADPTMYGRTYKDKFVFLAVYVDDTSIFSPFYNEMKSVTRPSKHLFVTRLSDKTEKFLDIIVYDNGSEVKLRIAPMTKMFMKYFKMG